jgi:hypothetical protein
MADAPTPVTAQIVESGALVVPTPYDAPKPGEYELAWPP